MPISETRRSGGAFDGLSIRWGRVAVFALGSACLVLAVITAALAALTAVTWPWPVFLLLLGAGCFASLRYLAVQERSAPAAQSMPPAEAETVLEGQRSLFDHEQLVAQDSRRRENQQRSDLHLPSDQEFLADVVFDDQQGAVASRLGSTAAASQNERPVQDQPEQERPVPEQRPEPAVARQDVLTRDELLAEARRVARRSGAAQSSGGTWEPVPVPKPTYARAAVAHRESPEALRVPAVPAPTSQSLMQAARAPQAGPELETQTESQFEPRPARIDLDDVLSRRRA